MTQKRTHSITPCYYERGTCTSFSAGHNTHTVQATLAGLDPRAWSRAVVEEVNGLCVTVNDERHGRSVGWHHRSLEQQLEVGTEVRVHQGRSLIEIDAQWLSVKFSDPEPDGDETGNAPVELSC